MLSTVFEKISWYAPLWCAGTDASDAYRSETFERKSVGQTGSGTGDPESLHGKTNQPLYWAGRSDQCRDFDRYHRMYGYGKTPSDTGCRRRCMEHFHSLPDRKRRRRGNERLPQSACERSNTGSHWWGLRTTLCTLQRNVRNVDRRFLLRRTEIWKWKRNRSAYRIWHGSSMERRTWKRTGIWCKIFATLMGKCKRSRSRNSLPVHGSDHKAVSW